MTRARLRSATADDAAQVAALEARCFAAPWTEPMIAAELARPIAEIVVAVAAGEEIVGYACVWQVAGEAELMRIAVDPASRRAGCGRVLLAWVIERARAAGSVHVDLEVARANTGARALYAAAGFVQVGERPRYYSDPVDDALLLRLLLDPAT